MMCDAEKENRLAILYMRITGSAELVLPAGLAPISCILISSRIGDAGQVKGFSTLHTGTAAAAMQRTAFVARPSLLERYAKPGPFADDLRF